MTSCSDILIAGKLGSKMSVKVLVDLIIPEVLIAAVFDGYVGFPPQRPFPIGERGRGEFDIR